LDWVSDIDRLPGAQLFVNAKIVTTAPNYCATRISIGSKQSSEHYPGARSAFTPKNN
jgi:hypothetical protein